jgi:hypothetical protein
MLNLRKGRPIAVIDNGKYKGEIIYIKDDKGPNDYEGTKDINLKNSTVNPMLDDKARSVMYIAGPSGSGKSTYAANLAKSYRKMHPKKDIYIFSRTDSRDDPAYKKLKPIQVTLDDSLITDPIDISEIDGGSLIIFDDCNTVHDEDIKKEIEKLQADIMEVGRKMDISIIMTNHLVNPNEKKLGRTIMNEMHGGTFFPKSGSSYQIKYCLKQYMGLDNKQIDEIMKLPGRWVTILKHYPMCVLHEHGAYLL